MTKEMFVSSTPHETKVAVVEDDQLAEIFFERENEYTLAGSIYKGRVTRVLPGMQSAFVDIGLERDAFLYVSDFLDLGEEDEDEFEQLPAKPEVYVTNRPQPEPKIYEVQKQFHPPAPAIKEQDLEEEDLETSESTDTADGGGVEGDRNGLRGRRRRRGRRGRGFPETKFARGAQREERQEAPIAEDFAPAESYEPIVLPGESISKYRRTERPSSVGQESESSQSGEAPFTIEGGFDESEPEFEAQDAVKEFAEPTGQAEPEFAPEATVPVKQESKSKPVAPNVELPFVLPGESIAKYKRAEKAPEVPAEELEKEVEVAENAEAVAPEVEEPTAPEVADTPVPEVPAPAPQARRLDNVPVAFVLPGESIAKYRPKQPAMEPEEAPAKIAATEGSVEQPEQIEAAAEPAPEHEGRRKQKQEGPRTEVRMERRSPVAPFVLPGESIAKYRNRVPPVEEPAEAAEASHAHELQEEIERQPEEELAQTAAEMVSDNEPLAVTLERTLEGESDQGEEAKVPVEAEAESTEEVEPVVAEHGAVGGTTEPAAEKSEEPEQQEQEADAETQQRYEQMNLASTFGGDEAEAGVEEESAAGHEEGTPSAVSFGNEEAGTPVSDEERHGYSASAGHTLEQEEIEDEESEYRPYSEDDEQENYVELEEETLEPSRGRGYQLHENGEQIDTANGLTDAVHDAIIDEETTEAEYPDSETIEDEDVEIETPEDMAEVEDEEFEESELESDLGEEHAVAHASPYPQRQPRPGYDRRRGRRGGRRMKGGGPRRESARPVPLISDLLKEGQEVLIQIAKEPIGKKGARITSHIALPGRYLVYMPTVNHIGVSRKINSDEERQRLKRIMLSEREGGHGGFIVRTAADGITEEDLRADIRFLKNLWHDIRTRSEKSKAPALIYHDLNLVERVLRDQVTADFSNIWVDTEQEYERILRFAQRFQPQLVRKVKLYTKSTPLYEQFGIKEEIDKALKSKVWLKSGGYIVINQTEALVAIDVNTGKYVGKTARLEDTIVKTNVDAIKEIVRQIRLRDLGGIIVIDFIDMDERKNRQRVMQALEEAMKSDRAPSKVLSFNDFGLVAITRKRVKQSLERTLGEPCPYCTGTGLVKALNTMCNEIYVEMRKMAPHLESRDVVVRVNPEVAKALKANGGRWIQEMEDLTGKTLLVKGDPLLHQENFDIQ